MRDGKYKPREAFLRMLQDIEDGNPQVCSDIPSMLFSCCFTAPWANSICSTCLNHHCNPPHTLSTRKGPDGRPEIASWSTLLPKNMLLTSLGCGTWQHTEYSRNLTIEPGLPGGSTPRMTSHIVYAIASKELRTLCVLPNSCRVGYPTNG
jgi:hypothetical protein